ncbi:MAG: riboflavin synthase [Lentisphaeria bacterium]|nr:riboflavin synthase [Lentisphaeria bacterium]
MFTGLIEDVGSLISRRETGKNGKLVIKTRLPLAEIAVGDSVAVNGVCLTVEEKTGADTLRFHTLSETLRRSNLGALAPGSAVNLERAMLLGGRLGGHIVQGHVDGTAIIRGIRETADDIVVALSLPQELSHLVIPKGSIAINGISLTIADLKEDHFSVHIIPHTWRATGLRAAAVGDTVNVEADMIGKYVFRQLRAQAGTPAAVTMKSLREAGW